MRVVLELVCCCSSALLWLQALCWTGSNSSRGQAHGLQAVQQQMKPQLWLRRTQLPATSLAQLQRATLSTAVR